MAKQDNEERPAEALVPPPPIDHSLMSKEEQVVLAERLQSKWLRNYEYLLDHNLLSSTDRATLYRFLKDNGWNVDPARIPKGLKDKLTKHLDPKKFDEGDGVIGKIG